MRPAPEFVGNLATAYRCGSFDKACMSMRWNPEGGHIPRGYTGATGTLQDVSLVICLAEPGDPNRIERYDFLSGAEQLVQTTAAGVAGAIAKGGRGFHGNLLYVIRACWPDLSFDEQLKRTWITEATLCSAQNTTKPVPKEIEFECASRYLKKQIALVPDAFILALGRKAEQRLRAVGIRFDFAARAVGRPIGSRIDAESSWNAAGVAFQAYMKKKKPNQPGLS